MYLSTSVCSHSFCFCLDRLEEGGVITDCSINTMVADEVLDFDFSSANVVSKIIMRVRKCVHVSLPSSCVSVCAHCTCVCMCVCSKSHSAVL